MDGYIFGYGTFITKFWKKFKVIAEIDGFKRIFHASAYYGFWYPFVIKKAYQKCRGLLLIDENGDILSSLDEYEDYPDLYDRIEVPFTIISDPENKFQEIDPKCLKAWVYIPSTKTSSLTLDRIFKQMKKQDIEAYKEMMEKDMWLEKISTEYPEIVEYFPTLFERLGDQEQEE